jgi:hypothetical protein
MNNPFNNINALYAYASGFYLKKDLTKNALSSSTKTLDFIENNVTELTQDVPPQDIFTDIEVMVSSLIVTFDLEFADER